MDNYDLLVSENLEEFNIYCEKAGKKLIETRKQELDNTYFDKLESWINEVEKDTKEHAKRSYYYTFLINSLEAFNTKIRLNQSNIGENLKIIVFSDMQKDLKKFELEKDTEKSDILFLETKTKMDIFHGNLKELLKSKGL
jgi:hypothetical protein